MIALWHIDADNTVDEHFFIEIGDRLSQGFDAVQGYIDQPKSESVMGKQRVFGLELGFKPNNANRIRQARIRMSAERWDSP